MPYIYTMPTPLPPVDTPDWSAASVDQRRLYLSLIGVYGVQERLEVSALELARILGVRHAAIRRWIVQCPTAPDEVGLVWVEKPETTKPHVFHLKHLDADS